MNHKERDKDRETERQRDRETETERRRQRDGDRQTLAFHRYPGASQWCQRQYPEPSLCGPSVSSRNRQSHSPRSAPGQRACMYSGSVTSNLLSSRQFYNLRPAHEERTFTCSGSGTYNVCFKSDVSRSARTACWQSVGLEIERLQGRIPAGAAGEFSSLELTLCADSYSGSVPPPCYCSGT